MQHRGQDAAGISYEFERRVFNLHKNPGLVDKVFDKVNLDKFVWHMHNATLATLRLGRQKTMMCNH